MAEDQSLAVTDEPASDEDGRASVLNGEATGDMDVAEARLDSSEDTEAADDGGAEAREHDLEMPFSERPGDWFVVHTYAATRTRSREAS